MSAVASRSPLGANAIVLTDSFGLVIPNGTPIRARCTPELMVTCPP
jgi:hypothetical protein